MAARLPAPGRFTRAPAGSGGWTVSEPPADHPGVARIVLERYRSARGTRVLRAARLAC